MSAPESAELKAFRAQVAQWLRENKPPKPKFKLPQTFMEVESDEQFEFLANWQRKVHEAGYLGMTWPKEYGGYGESAIKQEIVNEEMAKARVPFMVNVIALSWAGPTILALGTEEHKKKYIRKMLTAEEIWCQGFSEPNHGSDLASLQTRARRDGDRYVVNGHKIWTSLATYAKHMILLARTNPEVPRYQGISFFLCPMDAPGITTRPIRKITGEYGFNEVLFDEAVIPADTLVGQEGQGWMIAVATLQFERGASGGQAGGLMHHVVNTEDVVALARETCRDGRPAIEDPVIREQLVDLLTQERALVLNHRRLKIEKLTQERPAALWLMSKASRSEFMQRLSFFALKLQGANANLYMGDPNAPAGGLWQRGYMNSYSSTIGGGTSEVQRNIIGERLLGLEKG